jgi:hypothetical protein
MSSLAIFPLLQLSITTNVDEHLKLANPELGYIVRAVVSAMACE